MRGISSVPNAGPDFLDDTMKTESCLILLHMTLLQLFKEVAWILGRGGLDKTT